MSWAEVAVRREAEAWDIRGRALKLQRPADLMGEEMLPSLEVVTAAALALDGFYGHVVVDCPGIVPEDLRLAWSRNRTARKRRILETLKLGFRLGKKGLQWEPGFDWLFGVRGDGVHHRPRYTEGAPHPLGGSAAIEFATYNPEAASRAVDLLFDVLRTCFSNPKPLTDKLVKDYGFRINELEEARVGHNL
jgi:hypothetical protein